MRLQRRRFVVSAMGAVLVPWVPARATPSQVAALILQVSGGLPPRPGRVKLELPLLVENGNAVAMTVRLADNFTPAVPLTDIHVLAEANPLPQVAHFRFGPLAARPIVSTRIRLATSQTVHAVARFADGSCWIDSVELLVTLSACLDD